jgi:hypothetical protein
MPRFLTPIDLARQELRNPRMQNLALAPANPVDGQFYFDTALDRPRIWSAAEAAWLDMVGAEGTLTEVSGAAPIVSSGGTTPQISITEATAEVAGSMSAVDKAKLDGVAPGATANADDAFLRDRANHTGTQPIATVDGLADVLDNLDDQLDAKLDTAEVGLSVASLVDGKIPTGQLPDIAIGQRFDVADAAGRLALTAQVGDVAVQADDDTVWLLVGDDASDPANWHLINAPDGGVTAVGAIAPLSSSGGQSPTISLLDDGITAAKLDPDLRAILAATVLKHAETIGDGTATSVRVTHGLDTEDVTVTLRELASGFVQYTDVAIVNADEVDLFFAEAPAAGSLRVTVTG